MNLTPLEQVLVFVTVMVLVVWPLIVRAAGDGEPDVYGDVEDGELRRMERGLRRTDRG